MKTSMVMMAAVVGCIGMASAVSATVLNNGSFETGDFTGWTASGNLQVTTFPGGVAVPSDGLYGVNLNGGDHTPNGQLSQSFAADIGTTYLLEFDFAKGGEGSGTAALDVKVEGLGTLLDEAVSDSTGGAPGVLSTYDFAFIADNTNLALSFADSSSGGAIGFDGALDNIKITAIQEPLEYFLDVTLVGDGSLNVADGWQPAGTNLALTATPDAGWLFMGWSGDLTGDYTTAVTNLLISTSISITATFSDDADGDGLLNTNETALGTNQRNKDTDGDGMNDGDEVIAGSDPVNSSSVWQCSFVLTNGGFWLSWPSISGRTYTVQRSTNLTTGFSVISPPRPGLPPVNWFELPQMPSNAFFRVEIE